MLSFMEEDKDKDKEVSANLENDGVGVDEPLAADGNDDFMVCAAHGQNAKRSTVILAILFTVGALGLWVMIKKSAPDSASAAMSNEEAQIETKIAELTGVRQEMQSRMDDIVDKFYEFSDVEQVNVDELKKNPFRHELNLAGFEGSMNDQDDIGKKMMLREELERKALQLQLWSIMDSDDGGCCMINDKILYEGDTIDDFKINRIENDFVELMAGDIPVILSMGNETNP